MRWNRALAAIALVLLMASTPPAACAETAIDEAMREAFRELLRDARGGAARTEVAGFVVRLPRGTYAIVRWPEAELMDQGRWEGPWPPGTVAIVHTHPNWMPAPSGIDRATAATHRVFVYVVTSNGIARTAGTAVETVPW